MQWTEIVVGLDLVTCAACETCEDQKVQEDFDGVKLTRDVSGAAVTSLQPFRCYLGVLEVRAYVDLSPHFYTKQPPHEPQQRARLSVRRLSCSRVFGVSVKARDQVVGRFLYREGTITLQLETRLPRLGSAHHGAPVRSGYAGVAARRDGGMDSFGGGREDCEWRGGQAGLPAREWRGAATLHRWPRSL